ncbi:MAG: AGE family epimerase/isomerase, partial [Prolixibacteraceae bacterium]
MRMVTGIVLIILLGCKNEQHDLQYKTCSGEYWKKQALEDIIPYWSYAKDTCYGTFYTNIGAGWKWDDDDTKKCPGMISRHVFSYAAAYLLSGDKKYLDIARETKDFLIDHAWDKDYGGWFDVLDREGSPLEKTKSLFTQAYAITGLAMYYFVTHDHDVLHYVEQSNILLEKKAWDHVNGGYFNRMTREWEVLDDRKTLASQLAPVSGYILYLYLSTREQKYLDQIIKIMDVVRSRSVCDECGWALETFDKDWNDVPGKPDKVNIGHNLEIAWVLKRLWLLTNDQSYSHPIAALGQNLRQYGFSGKTGFWFTHIEKAEPEAHDDFTYWWVQAYGNMYNLCSFRTSGKEVFLSDFEEGGRFWDSCFMDRKSGDTFFSVFQSGEIKDSTKANPFKASYHSMEHCLLNFAYLNLWVNHQPVELHFAVRTQADEDTLYPVFVEDSNVR